MHHSKFLHGLGHLMALAVCFAAGSAIVKGLWNTVVAAVCGFSAVSYWQAMGLLTLGLTLSGGIVILLAMLFHAFGYYRHDSRRALFEKWHSMTDEQRREFLAKRGFSVGGKD